MSALFHHFLIGTPSSGKSTLAAFLQQLDPNTVIVSTDAIRAQLFGDEGIQGEWQLIEQEIFAQMQGAFLAGHSVIYDATNAKPQWRKSMLTFSRGCGRNLRPPQGSPVQMQAPEAGSTSLKSLSAAGRKWIGWQLQTPLELCLLWNRTRQRQVPDAVIIEFYRSLQENPAQVGEGFVGVNRVRVTSQGIDFDEVVRLFRWK